MSIKKKKIPGIVRFGLENVCFPLIQRSELGGNRAGKAIRCFCDFGLKTAGIAFLFAILMEALVPAVAIVELFGFQSNSYLSASVFFTFKESGFCFV